MMSIILVHSPDFSGFLCPQIELDKLFSTAQQQASRPEKGWVAGSPTPSSPRSQPPASPSHGAYHHSQHPTAQPTSQASVRESPRQGPPQQRPRSAAPSAHGLHASAAAPMTPRGRGIATVRALCATADWVRNGRVPRLDMERWLNCECRALTCQLSAQPSLTFYKHMHMVCSLQQLCTAV
jgi:hypothetical protein